MMLHRPCRIRHQSTHDNSPASQDSLPSGFLPLTSEAARLSAEIEIDNSPAKLDLVSSFGYGLVKNIWQTPKNKLKETKK